MPVEMIIIALWLFIPCVAFKIIDVIIPDDYFENKEREAKK